MKPFILPLVGSALAIGFSLTPMATVYAVPDCAFAASDPDGDGWGWENDQSCRVVEVSAPAPTTHPLCRDADSDPDGDGWGWENNQSCLVQPATDPEPQPEPEPEPEPQPEPMPDPDANAGVIPGQSLQTAAPISLDGPVTGQLAASSSDHWYQFSVANDRPIAVRFEGSADHYDVELLVQFADGVSVTQFYLENGADNGYLCIPPETYYLQVRRSYSTDIDAEYTFNVGTSAFVCEYPSFTNNDAGQLLGLLPDGYLMMKDSRTLISHAHDGVVRWEYQLDNYSHVPFASVSADAIYLAANDTVYALDFEGNLNWRFSAGQYRFLTALLVTDDSVYFGAGATLFSLNLNGTPRWINNLLSGQEIQDIRQGDNGSLYVAHGFNRMAVFDVP